jgi:hypothetical protein
VTKAAAVQVAMNPSRELVALLEGGESGDLFLTHASSLGRQAISCYLV